MKKTISTIAVLACAAFIALALPTTTPPSVTLAWDQSPDASVGSYFVYYGVAPGVYTNSVNVTGRSTTTATVPNLARGVKYYFAATCVTTNGLESGYSAEVSYTTLQLPAAPFNVRLTVASP